MNPFTFFKKSHTGFTLMEVMVAVSIFTIIVTVGIVALLTVNNTHKKSQLDRQVIDSLTFVVESMSRSLRTAQSWTPIVSPIDTAIEFVDQDGNPVLYEYDPNNQVIIKKDAAGVDSITPENVTITNFTIQRSGLPGTTQSYAQINIQGIINSGQQESTVSIQTSVSKRVLDITTP